MVEAAAPKKALLINEGMRDNMKLRRDSTKGKRIVERQQKEKKL